MNVQKLLISNGFVEVKGEAGQAQTAALGTVLANLAFYGYAPSKDVLQSLMTLSDDALIAFWKSVEPALRSVTGSDRKMDDFVVYKNFPREVLEKTKAQYWIAQILMYWGVPNEYFTEKAEERKPLTELKNLKVLDLSSETTLTTIFQRLLTNRSRWTDPQKEQAVWLFDALQRNTVDIASFGFRENGVILAAHGFEKAEITTSAATDVLRVAAALSGGDLSLRENFKFKKFNRADRQRLLRVLEECPLNEDFSMRPNEWKKLLHALRPGDYKNKFPKTVEAYDVLYNGTHAPYQARLEGYLTKSDLRALDVLAERPGLFARRLHEAYGKFGRAAFEDFAETAKKLDIQQLAKLDRYFATISKRVLLLYPPKGNWNKAKPVPNTKAAIDDADLKYLRGTIATVLREKVRERFPEGFKLDESLIRVKLQTNDQKLAAYGRGTEFEIPENIKFLRSASYWKCKSRGSSWFDNGWNFFDLNWNSVGSCCWTETNFGGGAAVFSGDPTNSKDLEGRACQMIDLYIDDLIKRGVRYAVWNVLAYSRIKFDDADDVLATLQMGQNAQEGNLYEPSRAHMVFPLKGQNLTKYVAYVDLVERKLVYMDANLRGVVTSADQNSKVLTDLMPAFVEYLDSLPSVVDLLQNNDGGTIPAVYSDKDVAISDRAFVFKRENDKNTFTQIDVTDLIG